MKLSGIVAKVTSRKFLLALAAFITLIAHRQYDAAAAPVVAWLLAEAHVDARRASSVRIPASAVERMLTPPPPAPAPAAPSVEVNAPVTVQSAPPAEPVGVPVPELATQPLPDPAG